jgi:hypothetical protein
MKRLTLAVAFFLAFAASAYAGQVGTASTWSPGQVYIFAEPYILAAFGAIFSILLAWFAQLLKRRLDIDFTTAMQTDLQQTALNAAGRIMARAEPSFASAQIDVHSPLIAEELPHVLVNAEDAVKALGITPDRVSALILAKVGQLQVAAQPAVPSAPGAP